MDKNKLQELRDIGFVIKRTCKSCSHSLISQNDCWGVCLKHKYKHLKHTGDPRSLSIHETGCCGDYDMKEYWMYGGFEEFLEND